MTGGGGKRKGPCGRGETDNEYNSPNAFEMDGGRSEKRLLLSRP